MDTAFLRNTPVTYHTLTMAFGGLRGGNYLHRFDPEAVIREALEHIRNLDYYSRDDKSRLGGLRSLSPQNSLAGLGDRSMSEELTSDTVRRYAYYYREV